METIQIVLDEDLLRAADRAAKRLDVNRSALIREALRRYLKTLHHELLERRDRAGYERHPDTAPDLDVWEGAAAWPED
jgi:metal-responsive CopG/Arc/MetJ family transcriptional regulator